jgi:hypothetical protein
MKLATHNSPLATRLTLGSPWRILLFLLVVAAPAFVLIAKTIRVSLAQTWGAEFEVSDLQRALALDPDNPQLHYTLGMTYLFGGEATSPDMAVKEMRLATALRPNSTTFWSGLGKACWMAADQDCADQAFDRAVALGPTTPRYAWDAAVNAIGANRRAPATAHLKKFLQLQPDGYPQVFQLAWRGFGASNAIWRELIVPSDNTDAQLAYLEFLGENGRFDMAGQYWAEMVAAHRILPFAAAKPYLEELLATAHYHEAAGVWQYLRQTGALGRSTEETNLVFNGGFEQDPLGAGFDWRLQPQPYVTADFADSAAHSGTHALRLDFTVPQNLEYEPIQQLVAVIPGQSYALSAYVRAQSLTSDSGPRFRVTDPQCAPCLDVATDGVTDSAVWRQIGLRFTAGPATEVVRISIWRPRSRVFPMEISGSAWFDDVELKQVR